jgi:hypothetical protein
LDFHRLDHHIGRNSSLCLSHLRHIVGHLQR